MSVYYLFRVIQVHKSGEDVVLCSKNTVTDPNNTDKSEIGSSAHVHQCAKKAQEEMLVGRFVTDNLGQPGNGVSFSLRRPLQCLESFTTLAGISSGGGCWWS